MSLLDQDAKQIDHDHKHGMVNFGRARVGRLLTAYRLKASENRTLRRQQRRERALRARLRKALEKTNLELEATNKRSAGLVEELYPGKPIVATQEEAGVFFANVIARMSNECTAREVFFTQFLGRLSKGEHLHGDRSFERSPEEILAEIRDEALDLAGWGYILWKRIQFAIDQLRADLLTQPDDEASKTRIIDTAWRLLTQAQYLKTRGAEPGDQTLLRVTVERLETIADELRELDPETLADERREPDPPLERYKGPNQAAHDAAALASGEDS